MPDPRLASFSEMCAIGRAFVSQHPTRRWDPTSYEFSEMVCTYLGAFSPLAARLGVGRIVRSSHGDRPLDPWGFALTVACVRGDDWRIHHDANGNVMFSDVKRAGIDLRTEVRSIFCDLLPTPTADMLRSQRDGLVPDGLARLAFPGVGPAPSAGLVDHPLDLKNIHFCPSRYSLRRVRDERTPASCAQHRAVAVHGEYELKAKRLDARFHSAIPEVDARPLLMRLRGFPRVRGLCIGAFSECSADIHFLCEQTADYAAERCWREAGAQSVRAARAVYIATYRRQWGCEFSLQGARLRMARSSAVDGISPDFSGGPAPEGAFDPHSHADYASAAAPPQGGAPAGQRR